MSSARLSAPSSRLLSEDDNASAWLSNLARSISSRLPCGWTLHEQTGTRSFRLTDPQGALRLLPFECAEFFQHLFIAGGESGRIQHPSSCPGTTNAQRPSTTQQHRPRNVQEWRAYLQAFRERAASRPDNLYLSRPSSTGNRILAPRTTVHRINRRGATTRPLGNASRASPSSSNVEHRAAIEAPRDGRRRASLDRVVLSAGNGRPTRLERLIDHVKDRYAEFTYNRDVEEATARMSGMNVEDARPVPTVLRTYDSETAQSAPSAMNSSSEIALVVPVVHRSVAHVLPPSPPPERTLRDRLSDVDYTEMVAEMQDVELEDDACEADLAASVSGDA